MHEATLLVIEDDAAIRRFVRCALEEQGHKVHEADTLGHLETLLSSAGAVTIAAREPTP